MNFNRRNRGMQRVLGDTPIGVIVTPRIAPELELRGWLTIIEKSADRKKWKVNIEVPLEPGGEEYERWRAIANTGTDFDVRTL
jgi:hypothetical protein